jgi:hypothetical protein
MQYALHEVKLINRCLVTDVFLLYIFVVMLFISHLNSSAKFILHVCIGAIVC